METLAKFIDYHSRKCHLWNSGNFLSASMCNWRAQRDGRGSVHDDGRTEKQWWWWWWWWWWWGGGGVFGHFNYHNICWNTCIIFLLIFTNSQIFHELCIWIIHNIAILTCNSFGAYCFRLSPSSPGHECMRKSTSSIPVHLFREQAQC